MSNECDGADVLSMFGLSKKQTKILFSIEKLLVEEDIKYSKNYKEEKEKWLKDWTDAISDYLSNNTPEEDSNFIIAKEIIKEIKLEHSNNINKTWYYLIMLEATLFIPYTSLNKNKDAQCSKGCDCAQEVLENYKLNITNLNTYIKNIELQQDKDKKEIKELKELKESLSYMEKAFKDMDIYFSDYQKE